jgi:hypothetical protein
VHQQARAEHAHAEGDPAVDLIDQLGERDLELSPDQEEETSDGPIDLYQRPEEEDGSEDEHQNSLVGIWKKTIFTRYELIGSHYRRVEKPQRRGYVKCRGQLPIRESSPWIWRNDLMLLHEWRDSSWPM